MQVKPQAWNSFLYFSKFRWLFGMDTPSRKNAKKIFSTLGIKSDAKIIEMGCGTAYFSKWFLKNGFQKVFAFDYSKFLLDQLKDSGLYRILGDLHDVPLLSNSFDLVFSDGVIEHFSDPTPILKELVRITRNHLVTLVPRKTFVNRIQTFILRPPKEYTRSDEEWVALHKKFNFASVKLYVTGINFIMIVCKR